jgi:fumarate hydratase class II
MTTFRTETDSFGEIDVPADKLWGAQTERSLRYFSIGRDVMPTEMITAYAILKRASATANHVGGRLDDRIHQLIIQVSDEILSGQHDDMFPLHVWMTGSGTQFNMNVNEVISNRSSQIAGKALGSKEPVHPNDHANMSHRCQSESLGSYRQDRPHPYAGCDAADPWPGMVRLREHAQRQSRTDRGRAERRL